MPRLVTRMDPHIVQENSLPVPLKLGEVLHRKHWQGCNSCLNPTNMLDGGAMNNLGRCALTNESYDLGCDSNFLCKVYQSCHWHGSLLDLVIT